jgi:hypothetical protein
MSSYTICLRVITASQRPCHASRSFLVLEADCLWQGSTPRIAMRQGMPIEQKHSGLIGLLKGQLAIGEVYMT